MSSQDQADQFSPPVGVFLAESLGLQDQGFRGVGTGGGLVIGWLRNVSVVVPSPLEQVVDGSQGKVEALSQGGRSQPALVGTEHGLTDKRCNGARHGRRLLNNTRDADRATRL